MRVGLDFTHLVQATRTYMLLYMCLLLILRTAIGPGTVCMYM